MEIRGIHEADGVVEPFDYSTLSPFSVSIENFVFWVLFAKTFPLSLLSSALGTHVWVLMGSWRKLFSRRSGETRFPPLNLLAYIVCLLFPTQLVFLYYLSWLILIPSPPTHSRAFFRAVIPWSWSRKSSTRAVWISRTSGGSLCCATRSIGAGKTSLLRWLT